DIFDGGPTMTARTDTVRTIRDVRPARIFTIDDDGGAQSLVATGRLADFRCAYGRVRECGDGIAIDKACAAALAVKEDDNVSHVGRL
ncbi:MAG: arginine N-succinyltransferase, partial [Sphingomonas bacterium]